MTIDRMNEIQEWLSPLDKYPTISYHLEVTGVNHLGEYTAKAYVNMPSRIVGLYFCGSDQVEVENAAETFVPISSTTIWEEICLRNL